jgi:trehalose-phosphatase
MSQPFFDAQEEVGARIRVAPRCLLCLDFDGTLAEFVGNPDEARLPPQTELALRALAGRDGLSLAVVSGRDRSDLQRHIGIPGLIYAGNHGLDISGPGFAFVEPAAASRVAELHELAGELTARLQGIEGAIVEDKGLTLSIHYRMVAEPAVEEVRRLVHAALAGTNHPFVLVAGEKVYEIRPRVSWTKASAVAWIRERLGKPDPLPIYVGDDATDEDAFAALREDGISVKVRTGGETAANYSLDGPVEVRKFLQWLDDVLRQCNGCA